MARSQFDRASTKIFSMKVFWWEFSQEGALNEREVEVLRFSRSVHRVPAVYGVHELRQLQAPESANH